MCGIAGWINFNDNLSDNMEVIEKMTVQQKYSAQLRGTSISWTASFVCMAGPRQSWNMPPGTGGASWCQLPTTTLQCERAALDSRRKRHVRIRRPTLRSAPMARHALLNNVDHQELRAGPAPAATPGATSCRRPPLRLRSATCARLCSRSTD